MTIKQILAALAVLTDNEKQLRAEASAAYEAAHEAGGTLTDAQKARDTEIKAELKKIDARREQLNEQLENARRLQELEREAPAVQVVGAPRVRVRESAEDDPNRGFGSSREFLQCVMDATTGRRMDARLAPLRIGAAAGSDEHSTYDNPHGGFFVPEGMQGGVLQIAPEADPLASRVRRIPMSNNRVKLRARVDKNHSSSVSGGLRVYRREEAATVLSSRVEHEEIALNANSLMGVSFESNELLRDSPTSFAALIADGFSDEFGSRILQERITGTGAGQFLGVLNSPCLISVAKEGGQAADTILGANIIKMRKRCWRYSQAVWLANHDTYDQLTDVHISGTNDDRFLFAPGNGVDVPDTLLGRPVIFTEYCKTVGDQGDLILGVWSEYLEGVLQNLERAESLHVRFLENESTFRFTMRNDGAPWWRSALTPKNSTVTLSPFVTLDDRA